jgi:hypothetical protein
VCAAAVIVKTRRAKTDQLAKISMAASNRRA